MTSTGGRSLWPIGIAIGVNAVAAAACVGLFAIAPDRAGAWLAIAGLVFFGLAAGGFAMMLRLRLAAR